MTTTRVNRGWTITCDFSNCSHQITAPSIGDFWNSPHSDTWTARRINGKWFHYCAAHRDHVFSPDFRILTKGLSHD